MTWAGAATWSPSTPWAEESSGFGLGWASAADWIPSAPWADEAVARPLRASFPRARIAPNAHRAELGRPTTESGD